MVTLHVRQKSSAHPRQQFGWSSIAMVYRVEDELNSPRDARLVEDPEKVFLDRALSREFPGRQE